MSKRHTRELAVFGAAGVLATAAVGWFVLPSNASSALRIHSSPIPTGTRLTTLMHDSQYRSAIAWQNTAYNQPPHPSFFLGDGMTIPAQPAIHVR